MKDPWFNLPMNNIPTQLSAFGAITIMISTGTIEGEMGKLVRSVTAVLPAKTALLWMPFFTFSARVAMRFSWISGKRAVRSCAVNAT